MKMVFQFFLTLKDLEWFLAGETPLDPESEPEIHIYSNSSFGEMSIGIAKSGTCGLVFESSKRCSLIMF